MKKNLKRSIILTSILALLAVLYFLPSLSKKIYSPEKKLLNLKGQIQELEVQFAKDKIQKLKREKDQWIVEYQGKKIPADQERVEKILSALNNLAYSEIVSKNAEKQAETLQLKNKYIKIKTSADEQAKIWIGKSAGVNKVFIRLQDSNEVLIVEDLASLLLPEDLRDLNIGFLKNPDDVEQLILESAAKKISLTKKGQNWMVNEKKAENLNVQNYLITLQDMKAQDLVSADEQPLQNPVLTLQITEKGETKTFQISKLQEDYLISNSERKEFLFKISSFQFQNIDKTEADFLTDQE